MTQLQEKALAALLTCTTNEEACRVSGVSHKTMYRYLADSAFVAEYNRRRDEQTRATADRMQRAAAGALDKLEEVLQNGSDGAKVSAARTILEYALKYTEKRDVLQRIQKLQRLTASAKVEIKQDRTQGSVRALQVGRV